MRFMRAMNTLMLLMITVPAFAHSSQNPEGISETVVNEDDFRIQRKFLEVDAGSGFVGKAVDIFGAGNGKVFSTNWLNVKLRPFTEEWKWESIGVQFGLHQSDDMMKNSACRAAPSIAGRRFCSTNDMEFAEGVHFSAFYSGVHAELVEFFAREPRPTQVYLGAGASMIQSISFEPMLVPYSSIEVGFQLRKQVSGRAGVFVALPKDTNTFGVAAPEVSLRYIF